MKHNVSSNKLRVTSSAFHFINCPLPHPPERPNLSDWEFLERHFFRDLPYGRHWNVSGNTHVSRSRVYGSMDLTSVKERNVPDVRVCQSGKLHGHRLYFGDRSRSSKTMG